MEKSTIPNRSGLSSGTIALIAILLAFVLLLVFIWLWYDIKLHSLDKKVKAPAKSVTVMLRNPINFHSNILHLPIQNHQL